jgi:hypothetical protein
MTSNPAVRQMIDDDAEVVERVERGEIEFAPTRIGLRYTHERVTIEIAFVYEDDDGGITIVDESNDDAFPAYVLSIDNEIVEAVDVSEEMYVIAYIFNEEIQEHGA